jgi:hypothetical protein
MSAPGIDGVPPHPETSIVTDIAAHRREGAFDLRRLPAWVWFGGWTYVILLINGNLLLNDCDTYWQIVTGQWILEHGAMPHADSYSFTKFGEDWISSSWLAQVLYALVYKSAGWAGPICLAAAAVATTFALLTSILSRRIRTGYAVLIAFAALVVSVTHFYARPHVLALPFMVAWAYGLLSASERREAPSFWLLPLLALWANLHGGFVFGLVLVGGVALDAVWNADADRRWHLALRWLAFGACACAACCLTPYGWETLAASYRILDLGELLHLIFEWMPTDFGTIGRFELCILALIAGALRFGVKLTPPRIALVLGLLHMALSHVRNHEIFVLVLPLVLLTPVVSQLKLEASRPASSSAGSWASAAMLIAVFVAGAVTSSVRANYQPPAGHSPAAAVEILKSRNLKRVLNQDAFGGYLIWRGIPVFIDGRAELYGEDFSIKYYRATFLKDVNLLFDVLKSYDIDAVLLNPDTPAAVLLDHVDGWQRVYADKSSVLHVRIPNSSPSTVVHGG